MPDVYTPNRMRQDGPPPRRWDKPLLAFLFYLSLLALLAFLQYAATIHR